MRIFIVLLLSLSFFCRASEHEAITRPSSDIMLAFVRSGLVGKVHIQQGQEIQRGEKLAELDSELEKNRVAQLKSEASSTIKIESEKLKLTYRKKDVVNLKEAVKEGAGSEREYDQAVIAASDSKFAIKQMQFEHTQMEKKLQEARILLSQTLLKSPISGRVERVVIEEGESVERLKEVIQIVQVDPLWIEVPLPMDKAYSLKNNSLVKVKFPSQNKAKEQVLEGKVIYKASVADAGSETVMFRIKVANPKKRIAGERVKVLLPDEVK